MDRELIARSYSKLPLGYEPPLPGTCHMRYQVSFTCSSGGRGFGLSDFETAVGHRPLGSNWFRQEKVKATSSFACQLQSTCKDLSRVDLDLPEGLLVGWVAQPPVRSPLDFRQAQNAAEIGSRKPAPLEFNVANKRKGCPRSV